MIRRVFGLLLATAGLSAALLTAEPASAGKPKEPKAYTCLATAHYGLRRIAVRQTFTATGQPIGAAHRKMTEGVPGEILGPIIALLERDVTAIGADPAQYCSPQGDDSQKYIEYECEERWTEGPDRFDIDDNGSRAHMTRTMPSGMSVQLGWASQDFGNSGDPFDEQFIGDDFLRDGLTYGGRFPQSLSIQMPAPWGHANSVRVGKRGEWLEPKTEVGEARVGSRVYRDWSAYESVVHLSPEVLDQLLLAPGDIIVTAYSTKTGIVARESFPRDLREQTEAKLKEGYRRLISKQRDPAGQCSRMESVLGPPIVVT